MAFELTRLTSFPIRIRMGWEENRTPYFFLLVALFALTLMDDLMVALSLTHDAFVTVNANLQQAHFKP